MINENSIFYDPLFLSLIVSPLAGIVFAKLINGATASSPKVVHVAVNNYYFMPNENKGGSLQGDTNPDDFWWFGIVALFIACCSAWFFVSHLYEIIYWTQLAILSVGLFTVSFMLIQLFSVEDVYMWAVEAIFCGVSLVLAYIFTEIPLKYIQQDLVHLAQQSSVFDFVSRLTDWGVRLILAQMFGLGALITAIYIVLISNMHSFTLMLVDLDHLEKIAGKIAYKTRRFNGMRGKLFLVFLMLISWICIAESTTEHGLLWTFIRDIQELFSAVIAKIFG